MAQQTAIEWLIKRYHDLGTLYYEDLTKAKQMEKEQIINAANITWEQRLLVDPIYKDGGEQYYNETYGKP